MPEPQTYKNHGRLDPVFHFFTIPLLLLCFFASVIHVVHKHSSPNVLLVPLTFGALAVALIARMYALKVQNRVIRLEECVRMDKLGIPREGLAMPQFVALRFAPDAELAGLSARARAEGLTNKQIKEAIVNWRADYDRV